MSRELLPVLSRLYARTTASRHQRRRICCSAMYRRSIVHLSWDQNEDCYSIISFVEPSCPTASGIRKIDGAYQDCSDREDACSEKEFCRKWWYDAPTNRTYSLCCPAPGEIAIVEKREAKTQSRGVDFRSERVSERLRAVQHESDSGERTGIGRTNDGRRRTTDALRSGAVRAADSVRLDQRHRARSARVSVGIELRIRSVHRQRRRLLSIATGEHHRSGRAKDHPRRRTSRQQRTASLIALLYTSSLPAPFPLQRTRIRPL